VNSHSVKAVLVNRTRPVGKRVCRLFSANSRTSMVAIDPGRASVFGPVKESEAGLKEDMVSGAAAGSNRQVDGGAVKILGNG